MSMVLNIITFKEKKGENYKKLRKLASGFKEFKRNAKS